MIRIVYIIFCIAFYATNVWAESCKNTKSCNLDEVAHHQNPGSPKYIKIDTTPAASRQEKVVRWSEESVRRHVENTRRLAGRDEPTASISLYDSLAAVLGDTQPGFQPINDFACEDCEEPIDDLRLDTRRRPSSPTDEKAAPGGNHQDYAFGTVPVDHLWYDWQTASQINNHIDNGYRVVDVELRQASPWRWSVLLVKNEGAYERDSKWVHDASSTQLGYLVNEENYRVTKLKPRQVGTAIRFSAVLEKNTGFNNKNWSWYWDASFDWLIDTFEDGNYRPVDIEAYQWNGQTRFAGVAIKNTGADYRPWSVVDGITNASVDSLGRTIYWYRFTDLDVVDQHYYGIFTGSPILGYVKEGENHWTHAMVPQNKVAHILKRHGARIISIQQAPIIYAAQNTWTITMVDNGMPVTGNALDGLALVDEVMIDAMKKASIPGGSIAIAKNGKLVYARGYGYADIGQNQLATAETMFRMGSISKPVTGIAIQRLIESGVETYSGSPLTLETNIFSDVIFPYLDPAGEGLNLALNHPHLLPIKLKHLLSHTAGWYEQGEDWGFGLTGFNGPMPLNNTVTIATEMNMQTTPKCKEIVEYYLPSPLDTYPGTNVLYSGLGICAAALTIEILSGQSYEEYVMNELADALDLNKGKMRFGPSKDYYSQKYDTEARFYPFFMEQEVTPTLIEMADDFADNGAPIFTDTVESPYGAIPMKSTMPAGGWSASTIAMVRIATAMQRTRRPYYLDYSSFEKMFENFAASENGSWGITGFTTSGTAIAHAGSQPGGWGYWRTEKDGTTFAIFFNALPVNNLSKWGIINDVKSAVVYTEDAFTYSGVDLFPQYGFVEPQLTLPFPIGGGSPELTLEDNGVEAKQVQILTAPATLIEPSQPVQMFSIQQ